MTAVQKQVVTLMLLLSCAVAQTTKGPATVQSVTVTRAGADLRVEVTLSCPVKSTADVAVHPDRIVVDFPDTICDSKTTAQKIEVNGNGVLRVRTGQHTAPSQD